jgi:isoamylase
LIGSPSLYDHKRREPEASVNFVTCHDGFTLNDLVSYDRKHNEPNGEDNRDGTDDNRSWNCGAEGPTDDPAVEKLRTRQIKNFFTATMLAAGMPMMLMGDEVRRTQRGNNNAYCQDNETSWFDWTLLEEWAELHRFVSVLNRCRISRDIEHEQQRVPLSQLIRQAHLTWHGVTLNQPDWSDTSHSIAFTSRFASRHMLFHAMFNAYWQPLDFELPPVVGSAQTQWHRWIDTFLDAPYDIVEWEDAPTIAGATYRLAPRSVVVLFARFTRPE